jgi:phosphatidylserine/phosphatidylglycerophosphate/cardiolipin synthase-like enzyme
MCASKARSGMLHAKTMAVDGIWGTVGSANLDNRSLSPTTESLSLISRRCSVMILRTPG